VHQAGSSSIPPRTYARRSAFVRNRGLGDPVLALTLGMPLNTISGRLARAFAAYDGR
jgi:hypothetical protein